MRLNLTQHGERYQVRTIQGLTDCELFLDLSDGGAWPFLVGGVICLVDSDNERDLCLTIVRSVAWGASKQAKETFLAGGLPVGTKLAPVCPSGQAVSIPRLLRTPLNHTPPTTNHTHHACVCVWGGVGGVSIGVVKKKRKIFLRGCFPPCGESRLL